MPPANFPLPSKVGRFHGIGHRHLWGSFFYLLIEMLILIESATYESPLEKLECFSAP